MPRTSRTSQAASLPVEGEGSSSSMWSTRSRSRTARAATAVTTNNSSSNATDASVGTASASSVSFTSPPASSRGGVSEAESYATRAGLSVVADDEDDVGMEDEERDGQTPSRSYVDTTNNASNFLQDSDEEDHSGNIDADSLADADPEEVEARAFENLGWDDIGKDKELFAIDLKRWNSISEAHRQPGTPENDAVKQIQTSLLEAVQELDSTDWMYPQPAPFLPGAIQAGSFSEGPPDAFSALLPNENNTWLDVAFNPLSTFTPRAPALSGTFPSADRVRAAVESTLMPDVSFLDAQRKAYPNHGENAFAASANFPWAATAMNTSMSAGGSGGVSARSSLAREVSIIAL